MKVSTTAKGSISARMSETRIGGETKRMNNVVNVVAVVSLKVYQLILDGQG